ncbi:hypothetical protein GCM10010348_77610 [Streptomyces anthocyanicus]|uniref:hypothetical protein n=1 Tax=Streptomyces anthocyanicus TaxID=68174 RepID=UPI001875FC1E|nr:hypothetical protein [Streptomyces anthocyanicus]GHC38697.1 hypothetical protein GCM10010348_77610 [Streptomyces anthocyanicus]
MNVIVCHARHFTIRRIWRCPTCKTRRRMLFQDEAWYGMTMTCCHCGDRWQDGELCPRPAKRGWRKEAAAKATAEWVAAGRYDRTAHRAWLAAETGVAA